MSDDGLKKRVTQGLNPRTIIKLVIASIIVGAVFSLIGVGVREFWSGVFNNIRELVGTLGETAGEVIITLLTYFLIGAGVVVPIWFVARLLSSRK